jgi:alcohol dehydrogenase class IV
MFPIPHGETCARLLAPVTEVNVRALRARAAASPALARYDEAARILTGSPTARAEDAAAWLRDLVDELHLPRLGAYGVTEADAPRVVEPARRASSMQGNPIALTDDELCEILRAAL